MHCHFLGSKLEVVCLPTAVGGLWVVGDALSLVVLGPCLGN